jgi:hypothetical protein
VQSGRWIPTFWRKMEATYSSEILVTTYQTAQYHNPKDYNTSDELKSVGPPKYL